jgi:hypothetical protein
MFLYNKIYAATYLYYAKFKNENPRSRATLMLLVCQNFLFFLILGVIKKVFEYDFSKLLPNKFYYFPIIIVWYLLLYNHYSKDKSESILSEYASKSSYYKKRCGIITVLHFILPVILLAILLKK